MFGGSRLPELKYTAHHHSLASCFLFPCGAAVFTTRLTPRQCQPRRVRHVDARVSHVVLYVVFFGDVLVLDVRFTVFRGVLHCTLVVCFLGLQMFANVSYLRLLYRHV